MKSSSSKSLIETFGVVAIIVSLIFLGYELKRANDIAEAEATATIDQGDNEFILTAIADQNIRRVIRNAFGISESSTDDEHVLRIMSTYFYNIQTISWKYHQKGLLSDEDLAARFTELCGWLTESPAIAEDWAGRRDIMLPGFYEDVNRECKITDE